MYVEHVELTDFRNHEHSTVTLAPGLNVLAGANGLGKTNFLEAIHLLGGRNPPRFGGNPHLIRWGCGLARAEARICDATGDARATLEISPTSRRLLVNGKRVRALSASPLVTALFCPETLSLVKEGAQARRELVDDLIERLQPAYGKTRADYSRVVRQRNKVLQQGHVTTEKLEPWDEALARLGAEITLRRANAVNRIAPRVSGAYATLAEGTTGSVKTYYASRVATQTEDAADVAKGISTHLASRRADEIARGMTLVGPHRDDVAIELDGHGFRGFGSQGEQRTAALSLVFAEAEMLHEAMGDAPVLLLDDVLSELDEGRRERLLGRLATGGQSIVTTSSPAVLGGAASVAHMLDVSRGTASDG